MRRMAAFLLLLSLLIPKAQAKSEKYIALTFDDGPSGRYTQRLLDGLAKRDVKVTFLLCGYRMETYPKMVQTIYEQGHEIGLHGYSHKDMSKMTLHEIAGELSDTAALLPKGCRPAFLRPPGGASSQQTAQAAKSAGLALLNWSVDPRDWATHDAAAVQTAVVQNIQDGDVILLHDMCDCSVDAALAIIDTLRAQGFQFVTVSELARIKGVSPQPGVMYTCFR